MHWCHHSSHESSLTLKSLSIVGQETPHNHWTPGWLIQTWNLNSTLLRNVTKTIFNCTVPMENQHHTRNKPTQSIFVLFKASQPVWKIIQMLYCILPLQRFNWRSSTQDNAYYLSFHSAISKLASSIWKIRLSQTSERRHHSILYVTVKLQN